MNSRWSCHRRGGLHWGMSALCRAMLALMLSLGCGCASTGVRHSDRVVALTLIDTHVNVDLSDLDCAGCLDYDGHQLLAGEELAAVVPSHVVPAGKGPFVAVNSNGHWLVAFSGSTPSHEEDYAYGLFRDDWTMAGWVETPATRNHHRRKFLFLDWCPQGSIAVVAEDVGGQLRVGTCGPGSLRLREIFHTDQASSIEFHSWFESTLIITQEKGAVWSIDPIAGNSALVCELPVGRGFVHAVRASPDGRYLAVEMGDFKRRESGLWIVDLQTGRSEPLTWERTTYRHRPICWSAPDTIRFLRRTSPETGYQHFEARLDFTEW